MRRSKGVRGMTFIETLITLAVLATVMIGLYTLLDRSNKLAKQETNVSEAQQSSRVGIYELSRVIRQARVGGLFVANAILPMAPDGSTGNNSAGGVFLIDTDSPGNKHYIRAGTDVIAVRGIFSGDKYYFASGDVTCAGSCATTTSLTVTIHATSTGGVSNFASGSAPSLINKTLPFYFVVAAGQNELVAIGSTPYLVPTYVVGRVVTAGTYDSTADTFTFTMNPQDAGAKKLGAATAVASSMDKPFSGGVLDEVLFFVDEGPTDVSSLNTDTHPTLVEATLVPGTGQWDIQPLVGEVEDFQVAYGVDGVVAGTTHDHGISPAKIDTTGSNKDEWVGNVANEISTTLPISGSDPDPKYVAGFVDTTVITGSSDPALVVASLRSVLLSLVIKSTDPDFVYDGPGARGFKVLDSNIKNFSTATGRPYRRRIQSFAVSLRNYQ